MENHLLIDLSHNILDQRIVTKFIENVNLIFHTILNKLAVLKQNVWPL